MYVRRMTLSAHFARLLLIVGFGVAAKGSAAACDLPPPPVVDLGLSRYYADDAGSVVDPGRKAAHDRATRPVRRWLDHVTRNADLAARQPTRASAAYPAQCSAEWLVRWARGGALLGDLASKQAEAERRWTLAGAALAYLKIKGHVADGDRKVIEDWLVSLADAARGAFVSSGSKANNHAYWLALGLAATAMASERDDLWSAARTIAFAGLGDIGVDGTLPLELARGSRALHYHAFACMPLVTLAWLAHQRGEDWISIENAALGRLVRATAEGLAEPEQFDRLAGVAQERPVKPGAGWLMFWEQWRGPLDIAGVPEMPSGNRWLGGNVLVLVQSLTRGSADLRQAPEK
ncbi:MAG: alginate lyase family protein [Hyphomicrobium sp.]|nr:alginate lyase family protein [Hyphomicrobium sp.]